MERADWSNVLSAKNEFIAMLKEKAVDRHLRWPEAKKKVDSDPRYKAVDSSSLKEEYYREYCRLMKEEKKKESKEKDRGAKKEKKDKEKKEKKKEKTEKADTVRADGDVEPTPSPDRWADIIGIAKGENGEDEGDADDDEEELDSPVPSPKRLRSSAQKEKLSPKELKKRAKAEKKVKKVAEAKKKKKKTEKD